MTYMAWFAWWLFHGILAEWQPTRTHHSQKPAIVQPPNKILLTSSKSTINYDPALKFTTRITFLTSIPPAERYGRDPEVYSVYLHVEPCRAMSSHVEPCRAMSSLGLQRRLKSRYWRCHPWSPARWSPDPVDPASKVTYWPNKNGFEKG